jgi:hypothetical protein
MIKNYLNRKEFDHKGQTFTQPSQTVPDHAMTPRQLLERYAKGMPLGGHDINAAIWDEENNGVDLRKLDLVDLQILRDGIQEEIQELTTPKTTDKPEVSDGQ